MHRGFIASKPMGLLALVTTLLFTGVNAEAARVTKVKGDQVLIDGEGMELTEGEKYFVIIDGKRKGIVELTQVKGGRAKGKVTKGKAAQDATIQARSGGGSGSQASDDSGTTKKRRSRSSSSALYIGAV